MSRRSGDVPKKGIAWPLTLQIGAGVPIYPFVRTSFAIPLFIYDANRDLLQG